MLVTFELPEDALARPRAEAVRRGVSIDVVIAGLASQLPIEAPPGTSRLNFIGIGHSGRGDLSRRHREIRAEKTPSCGHVTSDSAAPARVRRSPIAGGRAVIGGQ